jgi:hypothetical protein
LSHRRRSKQPEPPDTLIALHLIGSQRSGGEVSGQNSTVIPAVKERELPDALIFASRAEPSGQLNTICFGPTGRTAKIPNLHLSPPPRGKSR